jgi:hypothetical protein
MKKLSLLTLSLLVAFSSLSFGQTALEEAKSLQRPADCGVSDYDAFKNSSFTLKEDLVKTTTNYDKLTADISRYATGEKPVVIDSVKADISRVKQVKNSLKTFDDKLSSLSTEGQDLVNNATSVKPVTKIKPATTNTKSAIKAVDLSKSVLKELGTKVDSDIEKLNALLGGE